MKIKLFKKDCQSIKAITSSSTLDAFGANGQITCPAESTCGICALADVVEDVLGVDVPGATNSPSALGSTVSDVEDESPELEHPDARNALTNSASTNRLK